MDAFDVLRAGVCLSRSSESQHVRFSHSNKTLDTKINKKKRDRETTTQAYSTLLQSCKAPNWLLSNVCALFKTPTRVQQKCIPVITQGESVLTSAPTGSGKTLAFVIPALLRVCSSKKHIFANVVIVAPSRELARQICRQVDLINARKDIRCRLLDILVNIETGLKRIDILVSTPLKLCQMLQDEQISIAQTQMLILDEADKLLDMGFATQMDTILQFCPDISKLQICLFSATLPDNVTRLAETFMSNYTRISFGSSGGANSNISQKLIYVTTEYGKLQSLRQLIKDKQLKPPVLIFTQSKTRAQELFNELVFDDLMADVIHSDRTKAQRDKIIEAFRKGDIWFLICTDLMSRGVDFKGVHTVVNFDFPQSVSTYIHRIGRSGRMGNIGHAITFYTQDDMKYLKLIVGVMKESGCEVPDWMDELKSVRKREKKQLQQKAPKRRKISQKNTTKNK